MGTTTKYATSTSNSEPWAEQQPYIKQGMAEAKKIYEGAGPSYYTNSTVAGFSPEQLQAQGLGSARAVGGNATMRASEGYAQDVLSGKYSGDPYGGAVFQNIQSQVMPAVNSQFSSSGRYGSGAHAGTLGTSLTNAFAPYAAQQYENSLNRMDSAAAAAPMYAANDYTDINALSQIGEQRQGLAQSELDDAVARWNFNQDKQANKLGQYMGFIGGNYGGTTESAQPYQKPSTLSSIMGGVLGLGGLFG